MSVSISAFVASGPLGASTWVTVVLGSFAGLFVLLFLYAYLFCLAKNPDALRSERFTLSKMAIEKSIVGDNSIGYLELGQRGVAPSAVISVAPASAEETR